MIFIIILFLFANGVFNIFPIPATYVVPVLFLFAWKGFYKPSVYKKAFIMILVGLVLNLCSSWYYRGQNPWETIRAMPDYFGILLYFFFKMKGYSLKTMEKTLLVLVYTLDILYISQYYAYNLYNINFMNLDDWMLEGSEATGGVRLRLMSSGLYIVGMFYGLVNLYVTRKPKLNYLLPFLLGVFIMFLTGYRQFLLSFAIAFVFMLWKVGEKLSFKQIGIVVIGAGLIYGIMQIPAVQEKIAGMQERSDTDQTLSNKDYIRVIQFDYFENQFFKSPVERVLGAGIPFTKSRYGKQFEIVRETGIQYVDWAFLGVSWMLGTITVLGLIWLAIKAIRLQVEEKYAYFSLYFLFLLVSFTNFEFFRAGNFLVHSMILYMAEIANLQYIKKNPVLLKQEANKVKS